MAKLQQVRRKKEFEEEAGIAQVERLNWNDQDRGSERVSISTELFGESRFH